MPREFKIETPLVGNVPCPRMSEQHVLSRRRDGYHYQVLVQSNAPRLCRNDTERFPNLMPMACSWVEVDGVEVAITYDTVSMSLKGMW